VSPSNLYCKKVREIASGKEMTMLLFLLGLIVGVIFGIALIAILNSGATADQWMEDTLKGMDHISSCEDKIIIPKF
jgi:ABC-type arginine transport system permease subunit